MSTPLDVAERDEQRNGPGGEHEQHRNEHELARHSRPASNLELDPRHDRIRENEEDRESGRCLARRT